MITGTVCRPRPHERLWTLTNGGRPVDAELRFHGENGVEVECLHEGVMAYAQHFALRALALKKGKMRTPLRGVA